MKLMDLATAQAFVKRSNFPPNHGVFERTPFGKRAKPHCLYFYHLTNIRNDSDPFPTCDMQVYYHDNCGIGLVKRKVKNISKKLVLNARRDLRIKDGEPDPNGFCPPVCGTKLDHVKWRRKSYIVVVVDDPVWRLSRHAGHEVDPVLVAPKTPNHSFFEAFEWSIRMPLQTPTAVFDKYRTSAVAIRNHMTCNEAGGDLGVDEEEKFTFAIIVEPIKKTRGGGPQFLSVPIDPDGTNLGPPLGPP